MNDGGDGYRFAIRCGGRILYDDEGSASANSPQIEGDAEQPLKRTMGVRGVIFHTGMAVFVMLACLTYAYARGVGVTWLACLGILTISTTLVYVPWIISNGRSLAWVLMPFACLAATALLAGRGGGFVVAGYLVGSTPIMIARVQGAARPKAG